MRAGVHTQHGNPCDFFSLVREISSFVVMSDSETDALLAIYYLRRRKRRRRRFWVHPIIQKRQKYGEFHHLVRELESHPDKFKEYFRMTKQQFDSVVELIQDDIKKQDTNWRKAITPRERLAICLR